MPIHIGLLWLRVLKPIVVLWAGLKVLEDVSLAMRVVRLAAVLLPGNARGGEQNNNNNMCDLCDDVMGDLLAQEGISVLPCNLVCLGIPSCVTMCERVQDVSQTSTKYPCVAAGYCDALDDLAPFAEADLDCQVGRFFSCAPRKYCRRTFVWPQLRWSCKLRPGIGRWVGLTHAVGAHAGAVGAALLSQPHCSEPHAGPYCIARPKGFGAVCEVVGSWLSIVWGGYRSIVAIESPGGDDDTQWLTFWLILGVVLSVERFFARPILSHLSMYYEAKLAVTIWLLCFQGAERAYRIVRRFLVARQWLNPDTHAQRELSILEETGKAFIRKRLQEIKADIQNEKKHQRRRSSIIGEGVDLSAILGNETIPVDQDWEPDFGGSGYHHNKNKDANNNDLNHQEEQVHPSEKIQKLCDYLLSSQGTLDMMNATNGISVEERAKLLEVASYHVQFHPKYLYIRVVGTVEGPEGELPAMDPNGLADPYVKCRLVPNTTNEDTINDTTVPNEAEGNTIATKATKRTVSYWHLLTRKKVATSSTLYRTVRPQWNELLELPLSAGYIDESGMYRNDTVQSTSLNIEVWDADVEFWGIILRFSDLVVAALAVAAIAGYVTAVTDHLTPRQIVMIRAVYGIVAAVLVISYIMAVVRKADDDAIGQCTIPLNILLDNHKGEHALRLTLRELPTTTTNTTTNNNTQARTTKTTREKTLSRTLDADDDDENDAAAAEGDDIIDAAATTIATRKHPVNSVGGLGILRVRLMLSEN